MNTMRLFLVWSLLIMATHAYSQETSDFKILSTLEVSAEHLRNRNGSVVFCLWKETDSGFPRCDKGSPFQKQATPASNPKVIFKEVPTGVYAISAFHDEAGTGKIDTNLIGLPRSGIGVSGGLTMPPSFSKAKLFAPTSGEIMIQLHY